MIYLVLNAETEYYIIDICSSEETANKLKDIYMKNFMENKYMTREEAENIIIVKELDITIGNDIFWTMYPSDKEFGFTYNNN